MSAYFWRLIAPALALATASLGAQTKAPSRRGACPLPDTTAEWFRAQRAWFDDSRGGWSDDAFRTELLKSAGLDAARPQAVHLGFELTGNGAPVSSDTTALAHLRQLTKRRDSPWPTRSVVGAAGVRAVWLVAQRDSTLLPTVLHRMMEAGPDESPAAYVAALEDRLRLRAGRKQLYGTQMTRSDDGSLAVRPMEDSAHVDMRREGASLPPLAQSLCAAKAQVR